MREEFSGAQVLRGEGPPLAGWKKLSPALRASIAMVIVFLCLQTFSHAIPVFGVFFTTPFQVASLFFQGVLVGKFASADPRYTKNDYIKLGVISSFWTIAFEFVIMLIVVTALFSMTVGAYVAAIPWVLVSQFGIFFIAVCMVTAGAWSYSRFGGRKLVYVSLGIIAVGIITILIILTVILALLVYIGYSLLT